MKSLQLNIRLTEDLFEQLTNIRSAHNTVHDLEMNQSEFARKMIKLGLAQMELNLKK